MSNEPAWQGPATRAYSFWRGTHAALGIPALVLFASTLGYGAFARECGLSLAQTLTLPVLLQALPAQMIVADHAARGASLAAAFLAVTLTAVRLLPMAVVLMPWIRGHGGPRWHELVAVHFVAVTVWLEGLRRLPHVPVPLRLVHYVGIGVGIITGTLASVAAGYVAAAVVPDWLTALLLFLMPASFLLSLIETGRAPADKAAIVCGCIMGPLAFRAMPGIDLLATGLVAGTAAYAFGRWWRA